MTLEIFVPDDALGTATPDELEATARTETGVNMLFELQGDCIRVTSEDPVGCDEFRAAVSRVLGSTEG